MIVDVPFVLIPDAILLIHLAINAISSYQLINGISKNMFFPSYNLIEGLLLWFPTICLHPFCAHAQTHEEHNNTMIPQTRIGTSICFLGPRRNEQDIHNTSISSASFGCTIIRSNFTELPTMLAALINLMSSNLWANTLTIKNAHLYPATPSCYCGRNY